MCAHVISDDQINNRKINCFESARVHVWGMAQALIQQAFTGIPVALPLSAEKDFFAGLGACIIDLVTAQQRLVAAHTGAALGRVVTDWPPTPIAFDHPFLAAVQRVVSQIEAEGNKGKYARRSN
jgi:hypothetical protein